jgi:hypothetical protein
MTQFQRTSIEIGSRRMLAARLASRGAMRPVRRLGIFGAVAVAFCSLPGESQAIFHWFGACCGRAAPVAVAPVTVAPAVAATPSCDPCAQTVAYVPTTAYRVQYVSTPVVTYRPVTACAPCTGLTTSYMPVTAYQTTAQYVPYTTYRITYPAAVPVATTSYYAPATVTAAAPACCAPASYSASYPAAPATTTYAAPVTPAPTYTPAPSSQTPQPTPATPEQQPRTYAPNDNTQPQQQQQQAPAEQERLRPIPDPQTDNSNPNTSGPALMPPASRMTGSLGDDRWATTPAGRAPRAVVARLISNDTTRPAVDDGGWRPAR